MTFLHPEFFWWMALPLGLLFYFWLTQKHPETAFFSDRILQRLRAPETTMSLHRRNLLFLIASVLILTALAEPVSEDESMKLHADSSDVLIAFNLSGEKADPESFEVIRDAVLQLLPSLEGERIGIIAYDTDSYWVVPPTFDHRSAAVLIQGLTAGIRDDKSSDLFALIRKVAQIRRSGRSVTLVIAGDGDQASELAVKAAEEGGIHAVFWDMKMMRGDGVTLFKAKLDREIEANKEKHRQYRMYIPLFYYPLGLAILVIWIAFSSMSPRRSVPLSLLMVMFLSLPRTADAGLLDFWTLHEAKRAYQEGAYRESARIFAIYRQEHDTPYVRYNQANAFYKAGEYAQALNLYRSIEGDDPELAFRTHYNMGNCYVRLNDARAVKEYAKALSIRNEQEARENAEQIEQRSPAAVAERKTAAVSGNNGWQKEVYKGQTVTDVEVHPRLYRIF